MHHLLNVIWSDVSNPTVSVFRALVIVPEPDASDWRGTSEMNSQLMFGTFSKRYQPHVFIACRHILTIQQPSVHSGTHYYIYSHDPLMHTNDLF